MRLKNLSYTNVDLQKYVINNIKEPNPEYEEIIATDSKCSFYYAYYILKDSFKIGEEILSKNAYWSFHYAHYVVI